MNDESGFRSITSTHGVDEEEEEESKCLSSGISWQMTLNDIHTYITHTRTCEAHIRTPSATPKTCITFEMTVNHFQ